MTVPTTEHHEEQAMANNLSRRALMRCGAAIGIAGMAGLLAILLRVERSAEVSIGSIIAFQRALGYELVDPLVVDSLTLITHRGGVAVSGDAVDSEYAESDWLGLFSSAESMDFWIDHVLVRLSSGEVVEQKLVFARQTVGLPEVGYEASIGDE